MATRKPRKPKLDLLDTVGQPSEPTADVSLDNTQASKQKGIGNKPHGWSNLTSRFYNIIRTANSALDNRAEIPVTVIIPALLTKEIDFTWLCEAIDSVISQTVKVKAIVIENGSDYLSDFSGDISVVHSEKGLAKARNAGIRASNTEFFFPLDCNDWLPETALETIYTKRADKGFTYGSTMLFAQERGMGDQHLYEAKPYDFSEIMKMVYFPNGALQRRADWELVGGYREDLPFLEDWDYWMTAGEKGICGTAIPDITYWYRQHGGMVASNNHTPEWERVKAIIKSYHSDIYKGVYPPMCCGNKTVKRATPYIPPSIQQLTAPGSEGMILIEYVGGNVGKMPFYGAVTGVRYEVGGSQKRLYIDVRDAVTGIKSQQGFLELVDHGNPLFVQVQT